MATVGRRIDTAIKHIYEKDFENALIQISIAIDSTAKKKWSNLRPGERMHSFVREYESFIYRFASSGGIFLCGGGKLTIGGKELPEIIYKLVRCVLHHGDEITDYIVIENNANVLGMKNGKIIINTGHIFGLLYSVIVDLKNANEFCESNPVLTINSQAIEVNKLWGRIDRLKSICPWII